MKYYIIAGERSGDLHGGNLIKEIFEIDKNASVRCWGGDMMQNAGGDLQVHYKELAFMGFLEVLKNLGTIKRNLKKCKQDIGMWKPDVVVLIDYPGFNLRIAKFAKMAGFKVCYYISPKIWAWNQKRAHKIKKYVDKMYCILPFETEFYRKFNYEVDYVGNPLKDSIENYPFDPEIEKKYNEKTCVAILPGSRLQEIRNMLGTMSLLFSKFKEIQFLIAGVNNLPHEEYEKYLGYKNVEIIWDRSYDVLKVSKAAIVTSGTATLETALLNVPQIVCYQTSGLTYAIAKRLVKIEFISLVNLIAGKEVVRELIQHDFNEENITSFVQGAIDGSRDIQEILEGYKEVDKKIGTKKASATTARLINDFIKVRN